MKKIFFMVMGLGLSISVIAQDSTATEPVVKKAKFAKATFKSTRLINRQTTEMMSKGNMQFMIAHHFGNIWNKDAGSQNLAQMFGLNSGIAHTYLSLDYSPTNWGNFGLAAAGSSKFEGWVKIKLLRQQTGLKNIPVTLAWCSMAAVDASKSVDKLTTVWNKYSFVHQLLIARKFSDKVSLQLTPTLVHFNLVPYGINNSNNIFSLGIGGRYKLSSKKALNFEYSRQFNMYENLLDKNGNIIQYNPDMLALGIEFNTGGHVFEFFIGNTSASSIIDQIARNTSSIKDGQFALGFHLNRAFTIVNKE
jgi:hypothetical protein